MKQLRYGDIAASDCLGFRRFGLVVDVGLWGSSGGSKKERADNSRRWREVLTLLRGLTAQATLSFSGCSCPGDAYTEELFPRAPRPVDPRRGSVILSWNSFAMVQPPSSSCIASQPPEPCKRNNGEKHKTIKHHTTPSLPDDSGHCIPWTLSPRSPRGAPAS